VSVSQPVAQSATAVRASAANSTFNPASRFTPNIIVTLPDGTQVTTDNPPSAGFDFSSLMLPLAGLGLLWLVMNRKK